MDTEALNRCVVASLSLVAVAVAVVVANSRRRLIADFQLPTLRRCELCATAAMRQPGTKGQQLFSKNAFVLLLFCIRVVSSERKQAVFAKMPTVGELKEQLRELGEKVGGKKSELEARLKSAKRKQKRQQTKNKKKKNQQADESGDEPPRAKRPRKKAAGAQKPAKPKPKKAPTTYKGQILALGRAQRNGAKWTTPLSLGKIKSGLIATFNRKDGTPFRKLVSKTLKVS